MSFASPLSLHRPYAPTSSLSRGSLPCHSLHVRHDVTIHLSLSEAHSLPVTHLLHRVPVRVHHRHLHVSLHLSLPLSPLPLTHLLHCVPIGIHHHQLHVSLHLSLPLSSLPLTHLLHCVPIRVHHHHLKVRDGAFHRTVHHKRAASCPVTIGCRVARPPGGWKGSEMRDGMRRSQTWDGRIDPHDRH